MQLADQFVQCGFHDGQIVGPRGADGDLHQGARWHLQLPHQAATCRFQRHEDHVILIATPAALPFRAEYAHDREGHAAHADAGTDGIGLTEQLFAHALAQHHTGACAAIVGITQAFAEHQRPIVDGEEIRFHALPTGRPVLFGLDHLRAAAHDAADIGRFGNAFTNRRGVLGGQRKDAARAHAHAALSTEIRHHIDAITAEFGDGRIQLRLRALTDGHHDDDGGNADDHAQRGQDAAHPVAAQRKQGHARDVGPSGTTGLRGANAASNGAHAASFNTPSWISSMRSACAATCGSWVIRTTVWPSSRRRWNRLRISAPVRESSAPVGSSASRIGG